MKTSHQKFYHPYDPYDIQLDFMQKLYQCIEDGHVGIFESPTGTGKSLSLLCAALTWLRDNERRQIFGEPDQVKDLDWLEQAERSAQAKRVFENRREIETKLNAIRVERLKAQDHKHPAKRVKLEHHIQEQDLILDDYESDHDISLHNDDRNHSLSASTLALLDRLRPAKSANDEVQHEALKIIFCSRTHSQLTQFVNELRKVRIPSGASQSGDEETVKHIPLGSRKNLCINPKVLRLVSNTAINERCLELQKPGLSSNQKCEFLPSKASNEDNIRLEDFRDNAIAHVQDIEDIEGLGRKMKLCPYYASRAAIPVTEVVTLPYPLLLQKSAREALGVDIKNNVVIVDEAHNLTSAIADTLSVVMPFSHLELAQKQLLGYCQKFRNRLKGKNRVYIAQIIRLVKSCLSCLEKARNEKGLEISLSANELTLGFGNDQVQPQKLVKYIQESKLVYKVEAYAEFLDQQNHVQVAVSNSAMKRQAPKGVLAELQSLLVALMNPVSEGRFFIGRNEQELVLKYALLDPKAHFEQIVQDARAVVLAGGTMSPMSDWSQQLFPYVEPGRLRMYSFGHIIDKGNVLVQPVIRGPNSIEFDFTFGGRQSQNMVTELAVVIEELCVRAPDGIVVFFPSYDYLAFVTSMWKKSTSGPSNHQRITAKKEIFEETRDVAVDELLRDYATAIDSGKGALMLAVVGGKLSEGINFSDRLGRMVVCIGLPYPNVKSVEWKAKVEYIERITYSKSKHEGLPEHECKLKAQAAGREHADNTTMRAVNQSIGRAIRHKNDYAAIYLIDKRYATARVQAKLPAWLKESIRGESTSWQSVTQDCVEFFAAKA